MATEDLSLTYGIDCRTFKYEIIKSDLFQLRIKVKGFDVTNYVGRCHWINKPWDSRGLTNENVIFNSNNNILPTDIGTEDSTPIGFYTITISPTESSSQSLIVGKIIYGDLELNNGNGSIITVARFELLVKGEASFA